MGIMSEDALIQERLRVQKAEGKHRDWYKYKINPVRIVASGSIRIHKDEIERIGRCFPAELGYCSCCGEPSGKPHDTECCWHESRTD